MAQLELQRRERAQRGDHVGVGAPQHRATRLERARQPLARLVPALAADEVAAQVVGRLQRERVALAHHARQVLVAGQEQLAGLLQAPELPRHQRQVVERDQRVGSVGPQELALALEDRLEQRLGLLQPAAVLQHARQVVGDREHHGRVRTARGEQSPAHVLVARAGFVEAPQAREREGQLHLAVQRAGVLAAEGSLRCAQRRAQQRLGLAELPQVREHRALVLPQVQHLLEGDYFGSTGLKDFFQKIAGRTNGSFKVTPISLTPMGDDLIITHVKDRLSLEGKPMVIDAIVLWCIIDGQIKEAWDIPIVHTAKISDTS